MTNEKATENTDPLLEKLNGIGSKTNVNMSPHHEKLPVRSSDQVMDVARRTCDKVCSKKFLLHRLPILSWILSYNLEKLMCDTIAGVTTALTVIPQGIGYAPLAGLPLQYGLYGSIVPGFVYCLMGSTR